MAQEKSAGGATSKFEMHRRFQSWMAAVFLTLAALVGLYMIFGPRPDSTMTYLVLLLFVELPVFVIFALVGVHALVRRAQGPK